MVSLISPILKLYNLLQRLCHIIDASFILKQKKEKEPLYMKCKRACLVINPRAGQNIAKLTDVMAVLSAAGWKTDIAIKEYGGHTMELANKGAEEGYDLIIGYGGDGTLNNVVNGVMNAKGQHSIVGVIPGGTANVWASEVGIPVDPVKSSLMLVNSEARKVDIGHVEVESLTFPDTSAGQQQPTCDNQDKKGHTKKAKAPSKAKHHFLLMAGLGIDAAIMGHVSKPLKYKIGPLAVGITAAEELPKQHPFPIEIHSGDNGKDDSVIWKGEALQVIIGNTRRYGGIAEMTPHAHIDDGILDICVITAGDPLSTMQQITSLLLRRKPDNTVSEYFHGAHFTISVPASINMHLDGSAVKLKDYLSKADGQVLAQADAEHVMVNYRFDAMPRALQVAIPYAYDDALFESSPDKKQVEVLQQEQASDQQQQASTHHDDKQANAQQQQMLEHVDALLNNGRKVTVVGVTPNPAKKDTYIIAGGTPKKGTGENKPVAVTIDDSTTIIKGTGENLPPSVVKDLIEGSTIVVEGKQSKRGVIHGKRMVIA
jgi:YegS/Rv2252/BmrU family lipid kinase